MKALAVVASKCDNSGTLKAPSLLLHLPQTSWEQSGHYPTVFCDGAPCGSESAQLSSPPGLRLTGVLGRCVLSNLLTSSIGGIEREGGHRLTPGLQSCNGHALSCPLDRRVMKEQMLIFGDEARRPGRV